MKKQSRGLCNYCNKKFTKAGMIKHVEVCKERIMDISRSEIIKQSGFFILSITGKYHKDYWLIIECRENITLEDIDQFLRDIWLECCGHLSAFTIKGERYKNYVDDSWLWSESSKTMEYQLDLVLQKGMNIEYEYDFGSPTDLVITVSDYRVGPWKEDKLTLLARNDPMEYVCSECGNKIGISICAQCIYEEPVYLCEDCEETHECGTESLMSICNSPRFGVCGYMGSDMYGD